MQYSSLDKVSPTRSRRVTIGQVVKMPGPRQPGQAEEQLGDEEPGPVAPSDACTPTSVSCIKKIFGSEKIGSEISYLFTANLSIILFSLDILRCLETPILWNEMF